MMENDIHRVVSRIKYRWWFFMGEHASLRFLFSLYKSLFLKGNAIGVVGKSTDIVIEGYPRSANTFAFTAFKMAQSKEYKIAHHIHGAAQITYAVRHKIPAIVLIREPNEAIGSLLVRNQSIKPIEAIKNYISFYEKLIPYKSYFVTAEFNQVIQDFGSIIVEVNHQFNTDFEPFQSSTSNIEKCFNLIKEMDKRDTRKDKINKNTVAMPSAMRDEKKKEIQNLIQQQPDLSQLLVNATRLYHQFIDSDSINQ